jgi:predicted short-subunit dehydrogenase-like oxidoreductase (DUF2520 family)
MDIVMIGTGNVAAVLGRKFRAAGHNILQVVGRNSTAASALAYEWDTVSTNYNSQVDKNADIYIVAVSDDAIAEVAQALQLPGKIVAHTAASVPGEILKTISRHYGVFYPMQTLRKEMNDLPEIPVFFDGNDEMTRKKLEALAISISPEKSRVAGDDDRTKLHIAAVLVNNFVNHLYALAETYCRKEGLDFKQLLPLIEETATRIREIQPSTAQTGPAIRHDNATIDKHLELLKEHPQLKNIYVLLTESIQQTQ